MQEQLHLPDNITVHSEALKWLKKGNLDQAIQCLKKAGEVSAIAKIGDYYYYQKKRPLQALKFYKHARQSKKVKEMQARMIGALSVWLGKKAIKPAALVDMYTTIAKVADKLQRPVTHNVTKRKSYQVDRRIITLAKSLSKS